MRFSTSFVALVAPLFVSAYPMRRQEAPTSATDILVLKFANVLEQLETEFYTEALSMFQDSDFTAAGFSNPLVASQQFQSIMSDESTHTEILASTITSLGDTAISGCSFDFSTVLTDVTTMATVARLVENVGVGAYLGAAHLLDDPSLLTAAASIVTVEARHQTILNVLNDATAIPQAFDIPLLPEEVLALAGGFISGCDTGITALPALTITNTGSIQAGTQLTPSAATITSGMDTSNLTCQMLAGGMPFSLTLPFSGCIVPSNITGPVALWVTNNSQPLVNNARDRFTGDVVAGPAMLFIDNQPEALGALARTLPGSSAAPSSGSSLVATATITPAEATAIANSGNSTSDSSTATSSAASSSSTATSTQNNSTPPGGANMATGPSPDGDTTVVGWTNVTASS